MAEMWCLSYFLILSVKCNLPWVSVGVQVCPGDLVEKHINTLRVGVWKNLPKTKQMFLFLWGLTHFKDDKSALTIVKKFSVYKIRFLWGVFPIVNKKHFASCVSSSSITLEQVLLVLLCPTRFINTPCVFWHLLLCFLCCLSPHNEKQNCNNS